jgi:hypothetical protein
LRESALVVARAWIVTIKAPIDQRSSSPRCTTAASALLLQLRRRLMLLLLLLLAAVAGVAHLGRRLWPLRDVK